MLSPMKADTAVTLDEYISDLNLEISPDRFTCHPMHKDGFAYMWAGAKATYGIRRGRVCFEVKIIENLQVTTSEFTDAHIVRVGWSTDAATLQLGEDKNSFGYGGTAKKSEGRNFTDYGRRFDAGDVVGCYLSIGGGWVDISYCVNGYQFGTAFKVRWNSDEALYPHVLTKNCRLTVNFGQAHNPYYSILPGYKFIGNVSPELRVAAVKPPLSKKDCEVIMMVGLPGVGKTTWALNYAKLHPNKKYNILGTDAIIDKMRVQGLPRKKNFGGRWDVLIKQATDCFNVMLRKASSCLRNLILDQTNVYASARKRKARQYKDGGYKVHAMVLVPTDDEMIRRSNHRTAVEGKEVPEAAINDMKANFSLPREDENLFTSITFLELQRPDAESLVTQYNIDAGVKGYKSNKQSGVGGNENQKEILAKRQMSGNDPAAQPHAQIRSPAQSSRFDWIKSEYRSPKMSQSYGDNLSNSGRQDIKELRSANNRYAEQRGHDMYRSRSDQYNRGNELTLKDNSNTTMNDQRRGQNFPPHSSHKVDAPQSMNKSSTFPSGGYHEDPRVAGKKSYPAPNIDIRQSDHRLDYNLPVNRTHDDYNKPREASNMQHGSVAKAHSDSMGQALNDDGTYFHQGDHQTHHWQPEPQYDQYQGEYDASHDQQWNEPDAPPGNYNPPSQWDDQYDNEHSAGNDGYYHFQSSGSNYEDYSDKFQHSTRQDYEYHQEDFESGSRREQNYGVAAKPMHQSGDVRQNNPAPQNRGSLSRSLAGFDIEDLKATLANVRKKTLQGNTMEWQQGSMPDSAGHHRQQQLHFDTRELPPEDDSQWKKSDYGPESRYGDSAAMNYQRSQNQYDEPYESNNHGQYRSGNEDQVPVVWEREENRHQPKREYRDMNKRNEQGTGRGRSNNSGPVKDRVSSRRDEDSSNYKREKRSPERVPDKRIRKSSWDSSRERDDDRKSRRRESPKRRGDRDSVRSRESPRRARSPPDSAHKDDKRRHPENKGSRFEESRARSVQSVTKDRDKPPRRSRSPPRESRNLERNRGTEPRKNIPKTSSQSDRHPVERNPRVDPRNESRRKLPGNIPKEQMEHNTVPQTKFKKPLLATPIEKSDAPKPLLSLPTQVDDFQSDMGMDNYYEEPEDDQGNYMTGDNHWQGEPNMEYQERPQPGLLGQRPSRYTEQHPPSRPRQMQAPFRPMRPPLLGTPRRPMRPQASGPPQNPRFPGMRQPHRPTFAPRNPTSSQRGGRPLATPRGAPQVDSNQGSYDQGNPRFSMNRGVRPRVRNPVAMRGRPPLLNAPRAARPGVPRGNSFGQRPRHPRPVRMMSH